MGSTYSTPNAIHVTTAWRWHTGFVQVYYYGDATLQLVPTGDGPDLFYPRSPAKSTFTHLWLRDVSPYPEIMADQKVMANGKEFVIREEQLEKCYNGDHCDMGWLTIKSPRVDMGRLLEEGSKRIEVCPSEIRVHVGQDLATFDIKENEWKILRSPMGMFYPPNGDRIQSSGLSISVNSNAKDEKEEFIKVEWAPDYEPADIMPLQPQVEQFAVSRAKTNCMHLPLEAPSPPNPPFWEAPPVAKK